MDLSADVDFVALADTALGASEGVEVHGPVKQGDWLEAMGVRERTEIICKEMEKKGEGEEAKKRVRGRMDRLVSRLPGRGMGELYKVMAIVPERGGKKPVGFGGELSG